jgi:glycosyltransferase involved in cell wall biosynthesis
MFFMKSILFISPEYPPETGAGGIGTYVYEMARAIKSCDPSICVSVLAVSFEKNKRGMEDGVEVIRVKANRKNLLGVHWATSRWLLKNYQNYDVIEDEVFGGYCILAKMLLGKKYHYLARLHGTSHEVYALERRRGLKYFIFRSVLNFFEKFIVKRARVILTSSSLMGVYSFFLWNIDFSKMNIAPLPAALENVELGDEDFPENLRGKEYFLFYGSVQKKKGGEVLKRIIAKILATYPYMYFVILGADLEKLASYFRGNSQVIFFGYTGEKARRSAIIRNAKIVVLPSQFEAFLYTAVEAIFLNVPTIVTRNCGVSQYLKTFPDYDNIVIEQNNENEFMEKIESIMQNYENAKIKTGEQREQLSRCVEPKKIARQYLNLIAEQYAEKRNI